MNPINLKCLIVISLLSFNLVCFGQNANEAPLSQSAPTDKPRNFHGDKQLEEYDTLIAPYIKKAKKSLPDAKKKFMTGLKNGQAFFLTTRIYDSLGNYEQVFIRIISWKNKNVSGTIANDIYTVKGFSFGQLIVFPESDILDWLITNPDGSEEGNFIGNFLDTLR